MPKVSVIIPVYNVEKYLQNCIDSLTAQTLEDMELIFVNDASPDGSLQILRENEKKNSKIRVVDLKQNVRQGGARNAGIRIAAGEYIGFVDSDDFAAPDMYERLYLAAAAEQADAAFIQYKSVPDHATVAEWTKGEEPLTCDQHWSQEELSLSGKLLTAQDRETIMTSQIVHVWAGIYKRSMLTENDLFFPEKLRYEDNYWCTLMACYLNKAVLIPEVKYFYRVNPTSTVNVKNAAHFYDRITVEERLYEQMQSRGLLDTYHTAMECINIKRSAVNTFLTFASRFTTPDRKTMVGTVKSVKKRFPGWRKNKLFQKTMKQASLKDRILAWMVLNFPRVSAYVLPAVSKMIKGSE